MSDHDRGDPGPARGACAAGQPNPVPMPRDERSLLVVADMACADSAARVRRALLGVAGVVEVRCHPPSRSVWVRTYPTHISPLALPALLHHHGHAARLLRLRAAAGAD